VTDRRSASFGSESYEPTTERIAANYLYVAPEVRLGRRWGSWEPSIGLRPLLLMALTTPRFPGDGRSLASGGLVYFDQENLAGSVLFALEGGLSLRYSFL
jgi:hypothetical protein